MVQIKSKGVIGVESPSPRSIWCGRYHVLECKFFDGYHVKKLDIMSMISLSLEFSMFAYTYGVASLSRID